MHFSFFLSHGSSIPLGFGFFVTCSTTSPLNERNLDSSGIQKNLAESSNEISNPSTLETRQEIMNSSASDT